MADELTREQKLSKARNAATSTILTKHRKEFDEEMVKEAAKFGITWTPRAKTAAEKAREQIEDLLKKHPELREELADVLLEDATHDDPDRTRDLDGEPIELDPDEPEPESPAATPVVVEHGGETSRPAKAWVAGALREGRVSLDGKTFAYAVGGSSEIRRATVDGLTVKIIEED